VEQAGTGEVSRRGLLGLTCAQIHIVTKG